MTGEISPTLPPSPGLDSSHTFEFMAPQFVCAEDITRKFDSTEARNWTMSISTGFDSQLEINRVQVLGATTDCQESSDESSVWYALRKKMVCKYKHVMYSVNVTWTSGIRNITYTTSDINPQPPSEMKTYFPEDDYETISDEYTAVSSLPGFHIWRDLVRKRLQYWTSFAILDHFEYAIGSLRQLECYASISDSCKTNTLSNGTTVALRRVTCITPEMTSYSTDCKCLSYAARLFHVLKRDLLGHC
jgi:hypothetical protein